MAAKSRSDRKIEQEKWSRCKKCLYAYAFEAEVKIYSLLILKR